MTPDIEEGRRLLAAAPSAEPWYSEPDDFREGMTKVVDCEGEPVAIADFNHDAALIVWAVNNLSSILDRLDAAEREAARLTDADTLAAKALDMARVSGWPLQSCIDTIRALRADQENLT